MYTDKEIFTRIIADFHTKDVKKIEKRDLEIPTDTNKIISIIGPRRAGKSYYLFGCIQNLLKQGVEKTDIVYINFEDERINVSGGNLSVLIDSYLSLYPDKKIENCYFFFDEIQNIIGWEKFVRRLYDQGVKGMYITGSNAKLLSKEIATSLRGRSLSYELLPLSFKEFLRFKNKENININTTLGNSQILDLQKQYLKRGGFPEIVNQNDETLKLKILQEYFDVMMYNDIIQRYNIKNTQLLKYFIKYLLQTTTKNYSINKIANTLRSLGLKFDKNELYNFVEYLEIVYFSKTISKLSNSLRGQISKKNYHFDNGFLTAISFSLSEDYGKRLENTVFNHLRRKYGDNIFFLKNGTETDFVIPNEKVVIQVCHNINENNKIREFGGLLKGAQEIGSNKVFLITTEQEDNFIKNDIEYNIIPFFKRAKVI